ncbi:MAG TPA: SRPBCC family protein [Acetobacteraceae bacterium]|jgi:uncharacterized protein YndB with AHSA1/START domain
MAQVNDFGTGVRPEPLVISRSFAAPRVLVFRAWSSAEHMRRWFCPEGFTVSHATVEFHEGGVCDICMRAPDGQEFWSKGHYIEIVLPERLVFTSSMAGADGSPAFTAHTTVMFEDEAGGTRMTVRQAYEIFDEAALGAVRGAPEGWRTTLDRLEAEVARIREMADGRSVVHGSFSIARVYGVAPSLVFRALSDATAKARWFGGGDGYDVLERKMDVRPGGRERVKGRWASGMVSTFDAVYFDVVPDQRLVYGYEMHLDDRKISVSLATIELRPEGAGTRLVVTEQGAFLDGYDDAGSREHGTGFLLDRLGASLAE